MASSPKDGWNTTVTFAGFTAEIIDVTFNGPTRGEIDATVMSTEDYMVFIPAALSDPGSIDCTLEFTGTNFPTLTDDDTATSCVISWANAAGTTTVDAFLTNWSASAAIGERMTATCTLKATGPFS